MKTQQCLVFKRVSTQLNRESREGKGDLAQLDVDLGNSFGQHIMVEEMAQDQRHDPNTMGNLFTDKNFHLKFTFGTYLSGIIWGKWRWKFEELLHIVQ